MRSGIRSAGANRPGRAVALHMPREPVSSPRRRTDHAKSVQQDDCPCAARHPAVRGRARCRACPREHRRRKRRRHSGPGAAVPPLHRPSHGASIATWFGPGFYGQRTACGQLLTPAVVGVANRTLRCGTLVNVSYRSRRLIVPVIDRGPYANHADWDLTEATGGAMGIDGTATIGAVSLRSRS